MFDIDLRAVAAVGVRERAVRRGRAGGASARDEAGGRGAGHGVLGGVLLGAPGDPDAGPRQGAQVDRAGEEARALPRVPGRDAAPQAAHAGRRRGDGRRRGGRAASARAARCTACSPTPTCRTRPSSCRRASRCAWTPSAYTLHRQARVRADRDKVFASFFGALKTYERTMGATLSATVKAHLFEKRVRHFDTALAAALFPDNIPTAVYKQLLADVHRSLPTLHRYLALRKRMLGLGRPSLPGPVRAAGRERRHALRSPTRRATITLDALAPLGKAYTDALQQGVQQPLDRLPAVDGQAVGRVFDRRVRRAPVSAAELQRTLRRPDDAGARVGALDAHVPVVRGRSPTRRPTIRSSSPRSRRRSTRTC